MSVENVLCVLRNHLRLITRETVVREEAKKNPNKNPKSELCCQ